MFGIVMATAATALSAFSDGALVGASVYLASRGAKRCRRR